MLKKEEKEMFRKFTYIARLGIERAILDDIQKQEIAEMAGVLAPRITEILDYEKYEKNISKETFLGLVQGGFLKLEDADIVDPRYRLNPVEKKEFKKIISEGKLAEKAAILEAMGVDPVRVIEEAIRQLKKDNRAKALENKKA